MLLPRHATARIGAALADTRIVTVEGPRQAGKSTLCAGVAQAHGLPAVTLDDANVLRAAVEDPTGSVAGLDDVAPSTNCKGRRTSCSHSRRGRPRSPGGRFLAIGEPPVGPNRDSLAGRVEPVSRRPFTEAELGRRGALTWVDALWDGNNPLTIETTRVGRLAHVERIAAGGFPALTVRAPHRRRAWLDDYLAALVTRDVPDLVDIRRPDLLPVLLRHLAAGSGSMTAMRPIAQALAVDEKTTRTYVRLLELLHLGRERPGLGTRANGTSRARATRLHRRLRSAVDLLEQTPTASAATTRSRARI